MLVTSDPVAQDGAGDLGRAFPPKNTVNGDTQPTVIPAGAEMTERK